MKWRELANIVLRTADFCLYLKTVVRLLRYDAGYGGKWHNSAEQALALPKIRGIQRMRMQMQEGRSETSKCAYNE
jgi:hypothetical protein